MKAKCRLCSGFLSFSVHGDHPPGVSPIPDASHAHAPTKAAAPPPNHLLTKGGTDECSSQVYFHMLHAPAGCTHQLFQTWDEGISKRQMEGSASVIWVQSRHHRCNVCASVLTSGASVRCVRERPAARLTSVRVT